MFEWELTPQEISEVIIAYPIHQHYSAMGKRQAKKLVEYAGAKCPHHFLRRKCLQCWNKLRMEVGL